MTVPDTIAKTTDEWYTRARVVVVINEDTQRSEWEQVLPTVTSIDVSKPDSAGRRTVAVSGQDIGAGATLVVPGIAQEIQLTPDPGDRRTRWTATVDMWPTAQAAVVVRTAQMAQVTYQWNPPADFAPPANEPGSRRSSFPKTFQEFSFPSEGDTPPDAPRQKPAAQTGETTLEAHRAAGDAAAEETGTAKEE